MLEVLEPGVGSLQRFLVWCATEDVEGGEERLDVRHDEGQGEISNESITLNSRSGKHEGIL